MTVLAKTDQQGAEGAANW